MVWGIELDNFSRRYALKYATFYTAIVLAILSSPLYVYYVLTSSIYEAKSSIELKRVAKEIVKQMDSYSKEHSSAFVFPRFATYKAGLFSATGNEIFSLIDHEISSFEFGSHFEGSHHYFVFALPKEHYFGSSKLIVSTAYNRYQLHKQMLTILLSITVIVYLLSWVILFNFARPFKKLNNILDEFIKDSMHEIKTPLSIISANADRYLIRHSSDEVTNIKAAVKTLATVYDDMEYLIRENSISHAKTSIDFSSFLSQRVEYFKDIATLKKIAIRTHIEKDIYLYFSPVELQRLIDNNLSNAIKYGKEGGFVVAMLCLRSSNIFLRFRDNGVGIKEPDKVFDRYFRESGLKGGFGVGLAIVKRIADSSSVKISLKSKISLGTTFTYCFPTL